MRITQDLGEYLPEATELAACPGIGALAPLMDDEVREMVHSDGYDDDAEFIAAYMAAHYAKYGESWRVE